MTGSLSDLEGYLAQGREVMIELDDQRIWHQPGTPDSGAANHYVVVTGVDPSTNTVFINDPGTPDGREESIPLSDFESAWSTSNDVMIVTTTTSTDASDAASGGGLKQASPGPVLLPILLDRGLVHGG
jgi:predicted double-glycine peptidase